MLAAIDQSIGAAECVQGFVRSVSLAKFVRIWRAKLMLRPADAAARDPSVAPSSCGFTRSNGRPDSSS